MKMVDQTTSTNTASSTKHRGHTEPGLPRLPRLRSDDRETRQMSMGDLREQLALSLTDIIGAWPSSVVATLRKDAPPGVSPAPTDPEPSARDTYPSPPAVVQPTDNTTRAGAVQPPAPSARIGASANGGSTRRSAKLSDVPVLRIDVEDIPWDPLKPKEEALLHAVDGELTFVEILATCDVDRSTAALVFEQWLHAGLIEIAPR